MPVLPVTDVVVTADKEAGLVHISWTPPIGEHFVYYFRTTQTASGQGGTNFTPNTVHPDVDTQINSPLDNTFDIGVYTLTNYEFWSIVPGDAWDIEVIAIEYSKSAPGTVVVL